MTSSRTESIVRHTSFHHIFTLKCHGRHKAIDSRLLGPIADCRQPSPLRHALCRRASCVWATSHAITSASSYIVAAGICCLPLSSQYLAELLADTRTSAECSYRTLDNTLSSCYCHSVPMKFPFCRALVSVPRTYTLTVQSLLTLSLKKRLAFTILFATWILTCVQKCFDSSEPSGRGARPRGLQQQQCCQCAVLEALCC